MSQRDRTSAALVAIAIAVAPFAVGSAPRWAACFTAALCLACAVPLLASRRRFAPRPPILGFLALAAAFTAIQVLPLPLVLVELLSPYKAGLVADNAAAWGEGAPVLTTLSYDAPATLIELAKLCGYFAFACAALWMASTSRGRRQLCMAIVAVAVAMSVTAVIHKILGVRSLFGLYQPGFAAPSLLAPLLNPNHFAAYLALAVPVALGLAVSEAGNRRMGWLAAAFLCLGMALLTESRGGVIALIGGSIATGVVLWIRQRRGTDVVQSRIRRHVLVPALIIAACSLVLMVALLAGRLSHQLEETSTEQLTDADYKLTAWRDSGKLMYRHPWTGVGRGGFESAFTRYHPSGHKTYSHVENEYLQVILDWGFPAAAVLAFALFVTGLAAARRSLVGPLEAGALGGLVALGMHNAVDFNLQLPGLAVPALAALAVILAPSLRRRQRTPRERGLRIGAFAAAVLALLLAISPLGATAQAEADELRDALDGGADEALVGRARRLTERHPADYVAAGIAAELLARRGDPRAAKVMNRALALNPDHAGLHLLAAQMLATSSAENLRFAALLGTTRPKQAAEHRETARRLRAQALLEYGLALQTADDPRLVLGDLLGRYPDIDSVVEGMPVDPAVTLPMAASLRALGRSDIALAHARRMRERVPGDAQIAALVAELALERNDAAVAEEAARAAYTIGADAHAAMLYGRALAMSGQLEQAEKLLTDVMGRARARGTRAEVVDLLVALGEVQTSLNKLTEAKESLDSAMNLATTKKGTAAIYRRLAVIEVRLGNTNQSEWLMRRAERLDPSPPAGTTP